MPSKKKTPNKNTAGDNSIIINGDMNNSTIIIGDNSSLNPSAPTRSLKDHLNVCFNLWCRANRQTPN